MRMTVRPAYMGALTFMAGPVIGWAFWELDLLPLCIWLAAFLIVALKGKETTYAR